MYGPPGTGKTYLVEAIATEAKEATFFAVSSHELMSKEPNHSQKMVSQLFQRAKDEKPSVIVIDDVRKKYLVFFFKMG